ncbi:MAG: dipeptidase PepE, partial [Bacteroidota bacterium]
PYAGVSISYDDYEDKAANAFKPLGYKIKSCHKADDPKSFIEDASAIAVGGGNTFHLLKKMYEYGLIETIREKAKKGIPYIGWSAGSNMACPSIRTTNDMPIVQPPSFEALNLIPFQINPHFVDTHIENHKGETREQRIQEFTIANPGMYVVGLREGTALKLENSSLYLLGEKPARVFMHGSDPKEIAKGERLTFLLNIPAGYH